jgi:hypothetical protein
MNVFLGRREYAASAVQTEAITTYKGLQLAAQLGMTNIILEMDANLLATGLNSEQIDRSQISCIIIRQIKDTIRSEFSSYLVYVCFRKCNKVADCLDTYGVYVYGSGTSRNCN